MIIKDITEKRWSLTVDSKRIKNSINNESSNKIANDAANQFMTKLKFFEINYFLLIYKKSLHLQEVQQAGIFH